MSTESKGTCPDNTAPDNDTDSLKQQLSQVFRNDCFCLFLSSSSYPRFLEIMVINSHILTFKATEAETVPMQQKTESLTIFRNILLYDHFLDSKDKADPLCRLKKSS